MTAAPATLSEALRVGAARGTGAIVFHHEDGSAWRMAVSELSELADERAGWLAGAGVVRGDAVGIVGPNDPAWVAWLCGAWRAGVAVVPLPAPVRVRDSGAYGDQLRSLAGVAGCRLVLADERFLPHVPDGLGRPWSSEGWSSASASPEEPAPDDLAFVLCTSGSTGTPKGIPLSHRVVLGRNLGAVSVDEAGTPGPPVFSWLPFFHTAGVSMLLQPILGAVEHHVMTAERFARDPASWFRVMTTCGAATTFAAPSAWAAAARAASRKPDGIDLSGVERAFFTLEMLDPDVLERVQTTLAPLGLRPSSMVTAYGLSEGGGTMTPRGTGVRIDEVDLESLTASGRAVAPVEGKPTKRITSCGAPSAGWSVRVARDGSAAPERSVGEIQIQGLGMMQGYVRGPTPLSDGWLSTGDLGYFADGELYVTGRSKELIVSLGRNYHPEDIEWAAERLDGVRAGGAVAFSPGDTEGAVVVAVEAPAGVSDRDAFASAVRAAVTNAVGLVPRHVLVVDEGTLPKAANGKAQRLAARDAYAAGVLGSA